MSTPTQSYAAISKVDKALIGLLWNNVKDDPAFKGTITSERQISLLSPKEVAESKTAIKLSVFLYQINEFAALKNTVPSGKNQSPPLNLSLHYLFVPYTQNAELDHLLLDKIVKVFKDNPILQSVLPNQELKITMDSLSPEDLNNVWAILLTPYKTALTYSVSAVVIE
jgi:hypothetical protein